jgi:hypothetical protein
MYNWNIRPDPNCRQCGGLGYVQYSPIPSPADPVCNCWRPKTASEIEAEKKIQAAVEEANRLYDAGDVAGYQRVLGALADRLEAEAK